MPVSLSWLVAPVPTKPDQPLYKFSWLSENEIDWKWGRRFITFDNGTWGYSYGQKNGKPMTAKRDDWWNTYDVHKYMVFRNLKICEPHIDMEAFYGVKMSTDDFVKSHEGYSYAQVKAEYDSKSQVLTGIRDAPSNEKYDYRTMATLYQLTYLDTIMGLRTGISHSSRDSAHETFTEHWNEFLDHDDLPSYISQPVLWDPAELDVNLKTLQLHLFDQRKEFRKLLDMMLDGCLADWEEHIAKQFFVDEILEPVLWSEELNRDILPPSYSAGSVMIYGMNFKHNGTRISQFEDINLQPWHEVQQNYLFSGDIVSTKFLPGVTDIITKGQELRVYFDGYSAFASLLTHAEGPANGKLVIPDQYIPAPFQQFRAGVYDMGLTYAAAWKVTRYGEVVCAFLKKDGSYIWLTPLLLSPVALPPQDPRIIHPERKEGANKGFSTPQLGVVVVVIAAATMLLD